MPTCSLSSQRSLCCRRYRSRFISPPNLRCISLERSVCTTVMACSKHEGLQRMSLRFTVVDTVPQTRKTNKKRKQQTDPQTTRITDCLVNQMTCGYLSEHLRNHYDISQLEADSAQHHHNHFVIMLYLVNFELMTVICDDVKSGRMASDVKNLVKSEASLPQSWELVIKVVEQDSDSTEATITSLQPSSSSSAAAAEVTKSSLRATNLVTDDNTQDIEADGPTCANACTPKDVNRTHGDHEHGQSGAMASTSDSCGYGASSLPCHIEAGALDRSIPIGTRTASTAVESKSLQLQTLPLPRDCGSEARSSGSCDQQSMSVGYTPSAAITQRKTETSSAYTESERDSNHQQSAVPCKPGYATASAKLQSQTKPNQINQTQVSDLKGTRTFPGRQSPKQNREPDKEVVFAMIRNKQTTTLEFYNELREIVASHGEAVETFVDNDGLNISHLCVANDRAEFLPIIQASGLWTVVSEQKIRETSGFAGCNVLQFTEKKRLQRVVKKIQILDALEKSMGGRNAALKYCRSGDLDGLKNAVNQPDLNKRPLDQDENNMLHWACVSGNADMVVYIVDELKVDPRKLNKQMQNPLHITVLYGRSNLVEVLLNKCQIDPRQIDVNMKTSLHLAAENGDDKTLRQLKSCSVQFDPSIVLDVARSGSKQCMQYVLEECQIDPTVKDKEGKQCLMIAAMHGHLKLMQYLVEQRGMSINDLSAQNRNVLHYSAGKGHTDVTKYLIGKAREEQLAILDQKDKYKLEQSFSLIRGFDKGRAAWHYIFLRRPFVHLFHKCTKNGKVDASLVGVICKSGWGEEPELGVMNTAVSEYKQDYPHKDGEDDLTPLMLAILKGHAEIATMLIEAGADVRVKDCFGQSAMHLVAMRGYLALGKLLEEKGVSLIEPDHGGFTPLRVAQYNEHPDMINYLTESRLPSIEIFERDVLERVKRELCPERLREVRQSGQDLVKYVIQSVRGLSIDINILLMEIGSGPVTEESSQSV